MAVETCITAVAAALPIANLDTDQIMPKQFLRGIDKAGLARGVLFDLRFDGDGKRREDFVLNRPGYDRSGILLAGENFGCGSSREHAVWGLLQFGIRAIVAPSFGEIFYSNAVNNRLLLAAVSQADVDRFAIDIQDAASREMTVDIAALEVRTRNHSARFTLSARHRRMFLEGMDLLASSLALMPSIEAFERAHWDNRPWLKSVAAQTRARRE